VFAVAGVMGLAFLLQTLHRLNIAPRYERPRDRLHDRRIAQGWERMKQRAAEASQPGPDAGAQPAGEAYITPEVVDQTLGPGEPSAEAPAEPPPPPTPQAATTAEPTGPLDPVEGHVLGRHTRLVFDCWLIVFGLVGAQMSWVLRPFIGSPGMEFAWLRPRGSNFFEAVFHVLRSLLYG
jgi:hypothetical protein